MSRRAGARKRAGVLLATLLVATAVQLTILSPSLASFLGAVTAGPATLAAATLPSPAGLTTANGGCAGGNEKTNVSATWTASAERDANGNPLINGYTLLRSTSSGGSYSSVGTTGIATSSTDVNPSGAETPQVYVGNNGEPVKTVHAVNTSTNVGTSITTGIIGTEPNGMAVTPDGTKVVAAEGASHQVQIITAATHTVAFTVAIPEVGGVKSRPDAVAVTPSGLTAYVVDGATKLVYPITIATGTRGTGIAVNTQGDPGAIVITPDGTKAYVANFSAHSVSVITTASNTVTATVTIGAGETDKPTALAVTPNSAHVYVADQGNAQIADVATASNTVAKTIAVGSLVDANVAAGGDPNILAITPDGSKLYAASYTGHGVEDIATSTDTVTSTITLFESATANPNGLALTPNGCQLYVHDHAHNVVDVVTVSSDAVPAHPAVGVTGDPTGMSVTPDSTHVYVSNQGGPSVSVIATATNTVSSTLAEATVGKAPSAVLATLALLLQAAGGTRRLAEPAQRRGNLPGRLESGGVAVDVLRRGGISRRRGGTHPRSAAPPGSRASERGEDPLLDHACDRRPADPGRHRGDGARRLALHRHRHGVDAPDSQPGGCRRPDIRAHGRPQTGSDRRLSPTRRAPADRRPPCVLHPTHTRRSRHPNQG
jgi:YVTN family beta-propeller protein